MKGINITEAAKRLDELETKLTVWGVNRENFEDQHTEEYQAIMLEMEQLRKDMGREEPQE